MAPLPRRVPGSSEVALVQLRNCLVNLPHAIVGTLNNADAVRLFFATSSENQETDAFKAAQDIIVEFQYRSPTRDANGATRESKLAAIYLGWTGLPSKRKKSSIGLKNGSSRSGSQDGESTVEIDVVFARNLGMIEGQKVAG